MLVFGFGPPGLFSEALAANSSFELAEMVVLWVDETATLSTTNQVRELLTFASMRKKTIVFVSPLASPTPLDIEAKIAGARCVKAGVCYDNIRGPLFPYYRAIWAGEPVPRARIAVVRPSDLVEVVMNGGECAFEEDLVDLKELALRLGGNVEDEFTPAQAVEWIMAFPSSAALRDIAAPLPPNALRSKFTDPRLSFKTLKVFTVGKDAERLLVEKLSFLNLPRDIHRRGYATTEPEEAPSADQHTFPSHVVTTDDAADALGEKWHPAIVVREQDVDAVFGGKNVTATMEDDGSHLREEASRSIEEEKEEKMSKEEYDELYERSTENRQYLLETVMKPLTHAMLAVAHSRRRENEELTVLRRLADILAKQAQLEEERAEAYAYLRFRGSLARLQRRLEVEAEEDAVEEAAEEARRLSLVRFSS